MAENEVTETRMMAELTQLRLRVAELEQAQAESGRREGALFAISENIGDVIWELNRELQFTYVSSSVGKLIGYRPEEVLGRHLFSFITPESIGIVAAAIGATGHREDGADGDQRVYEVDFVDKRGNTISVEVAPVGRFDEKGELQSYQGVARDVTERKQAEQALRESEERFRKIFQESRLGIVTANADHRLSSANPAFCAILGYSEEELTSLAFEELTHPDHLEPDRVGVSQLFAGRIPLYRTEKRYLRKDGEIVWAAATVTTIRDEKGDFLYFLTIIEDISKRKQAEEERAQLEEQLRQAQKMEAIGTLAGGVAHDFNNLLTVILGFANLIQMGTSEGDRVRPFADQIVVSANKASELVRSLLAFSRKQHINLGRHRLNDAMRSAAKLLQRLLPEDIDLKLDLSPLDPVAKLDITLLDQVLMNLATNGRDAMPAGGLFSIRTGIAELDKGFRKVHGFGSPGVYALISVSDTGIGMDEYTLTRIFDPFFTTKGVGKGTGLGLASAYGIVKQHGGYITVRSEPLKGTTFDIYLPLVDWATQEKAVPVETVTEGSETILVVEDDQAVRNMIANVLRPQGFSVLEAANGEEAMRVYREHQEQVDLMLLDVVMPGRNGREVLSDIRVIDPRMRAIFMSGYAGDIILDKGVESESVDFIEKPLSIPKLVTKIREVLDR